MVEFRGLKRCEVLSVSFLSSVIADCVGACLVLGILPDCVGASLAPIFCLPTPLGFFLLCLG